MKRDRIYKEKGKIRICVLGEDKPLMRWFMDPRCPLNERQLRRRCEAIHKGHMNMSVLDAVTTPCQERVKGGKVRDKRKESQTLAKRKEQLLTEHEKWQRECSRVARSRIWMGISEDPA